MKMQLFQIQIWQSNNVWWVLQILEGSLAMCLECGKYVFEICAHEQFEANLKEKFNRVNTPLSRKKENAS